MKRPDQTNPYFGISTDITTQEGFTKQDAEQYWQDKEKSTDNIVSSTYDIRANETYNRNKAGEGGLDLDDLRTSLLSTVSGLSAGSEQTSALYDDYNALRQNLGATSTQEEQQISEAGRSAGLAYDPLIRQAEEEKRKGMPKALIRVGERGGLMSTQFAGAAALAPTEGGTFVGVGGELENVKSAYDAQISNLQVKQQQAIADAESAQRKAVRTGKQSDIDNMYKAIDLARSVDKESRDLAMEKVNFVNDYLKDEQTRATALRKEEESIRQFEVSEGRLQRTQDLQNAKFLQDIDEQTKKTTLDNITRMAESGIEVGSLSDEDITTLEAQAGLVPGTFEAFYQRISDITKQGDVLDEAKVQKALLDVENTRASISQKQLSMSRTRQLMSNSARSVAEKEKEKASKEEKAMWDDVIKMQDRLGTGKIEWGQAFDQFKSKWGAPDEFIDSYLDKEKWSEEGAFEKQQQARAEATRKPEEEESEPSIEDYLDSLKGQGYSEKDIEKDFKNDSDYGYVPDVVKNWLKKNY